MNRLTFEGNFCDIARCGEIRYGSFCEDGYCSQRKVWERLKQYEDLELEPWEIEQTLANFSAFLCEMTGNRMSKTNYTVKAMVTEAHDYFERACDDCYERKEYARYKDLEEQGRLVVLPVTVGGKVRDLIADYVFTIEKIEIGYEYGTLFRCGNPGTDDYMAFYESEIGEKIEILTRAEAEAAVAPASDVPEGE